MKKFVKILVASLCAAVLTIPVFTAACGDASSDDGKDNHVDYVEQLKLDFTSNTKKQEVTIRLHVDGDTTHFDTVANSTLPGCNNAADFLADDAPTKGYAKARYLAINTPESTGQIEEWGKAASNFTKSKLETTRNGGSIVIESNDDKWNVDSTGTRYLLWVWYRPAGATEFRNLNLEILQSGHAFGSGVSDNRYGTTAKAALDQAESEKLVVFSGEKDPDYYYGGPINVTLKELRFNTEAYANKRIMVEGTIVANFNNSAYIEEVYYDIEGYEEKGICIGMPVYYSYVTGKVLSILSVGNKVSVSGIVQYYEQGGYYQITDIKEYDRYNKDNPNNCNIIEEGVGIDNAFRAVAPADFASTAKNVNVEVTNVVDGEEQTEVVSLSYKEAALGTSLSMSNLRVTEIYTTNNEESASKGAMTITCQAENGSTITIRTEVLKDENGNVVTADAYLNKVINVKGVVELFKGGYQIKCHRTDYITVVSNAN